MDLMEPEKGLNNGRRAEPAQEPEQAGSWGRLQASSQLGLTHYTPDFLAGIHLIPFLIK